MTVHTLRRPMNHRDGGTSFNGRYGAETPWHGIGADIREGASIDDWLGDAGLDWQAHEGRAFVEISHPNGFEADKGSKRLVPNCKHVYRSDNGVPLGVFTDAYKPVQPRQIAGFFENLLNADERFQMETAGCLRGGQFIWALARLRGEGLQVGGDQHDVFVLGSTSFDGTASTSIRAFIQRVICRNGMTATQFMGGGKGALRIRHNTEFGLVHQDRAVAYLADAAASAEQFKTLGDALAAHRTTPDDAVQFFRDMLDIEPTERLADLSGRKRNTYDDLVRDYAVTCRERGQDPRAEADRFTLLQSVTRYVDHDRKARDTMNDGALGARVFAANFGTGGRMKERALELLKVAA